MTMDYDALNRIHFMNAYDDSIAQKVRVDFCTADGWSVNYYAPWNSNYVTNDPWQDFNPTFQAGVLNF